MTLWIALSILCPLRICRLLDNLTKRQYSYLYIYEWRRALLPEIGRAHSGSVPIKSQIGVSCPKNDASLDPNCNTFIHGVHISGIIYKGVVMIASANQFDSILATILKCVHYWCQGLVIPPCDSFVLWHGTHHLGAKWGILLWLCHTRSHYGVLLYDMLCANKLFKFQVVPSKLEVGNAPSQSTVSNESLTCCTWPFIRDFILET